jgi:hypothetical protein
MTLRIRKKAAKADATAEAIVHSEALGARTARTPSIAVIRGKTTSTRASTDWIQPIRRASFFSKASAVFWYSIN